MKKLVVFIVVVALIGFGGYQLYIRVLNPNQQVCSKLADLCAGGEMNADQRKSCMTGLDKLREVSGEDKSRKAGKCVLNSDSCIAAAGCMAGAGLGAAAEFLTGMKRALQE
jgi:hypothetical protein